jgi:hypothetical protein
MFGGLVGEVESTETLLIPFRILDFGFWIIIQGFHKLKTHLLGIIYIAAFRSQESEERMHPLLYAISPRFDMSIRRRSDCAQDCKLWWRLGVAGVCRVCRNVMPFKKIPST